MEKLIKNPFDYNPSIVSDKVLLDDHRICHAWYSAIKKGKILKSKNGKIITLKQVKKLHDLIVKEMLKRGFKHHSDLNKFNK
ncbi:MAG: hypothetical protein ACTSVX_01540, partial [Promethearchaeota archaeon]